MFVLSMCLLCSLWDSYCRLSRDIRIKKEISPYGIAEAASHNGIDKYGHTRDSYNFIYLLGNDIQQKCRYLQTHLTCFEP